VIQQNASASEQMSATSEELAAQAEQLQSSIAFFRIDEQARAATAPAAAPARAASGASAKLPSVASPSLVPKPHRAMAPAKRIASTGKAKSAAAGSRDGVALDLGSGGADHRDAEFERY
jgi:methyl-accepting chemotaxis protein